MNLRQTSYLLMTSFISFLFIVGCGDDNPSASGSTARIEGRVTDDAGFSKLAKTNGPVAGATVTVAQIQADGSLQTVSTDSAQTDANGEFLVETDLDGVSGLVVVAEKGSVTWKAIVTSEVNVGSTTKCQPHNDESTSEADVREENIARGNNDRVTYADISAYVDADVATSVKGDASAITSLTVAIEEKAEAEVSALTHASIGASQPEIQAAKNAKVQAQATLEAALNDAAGNQSQIDVAFEIFYNALVNAYVDAGIAAESYAKSEEASSRVLIKNSASLSSNTQLALKRSAARIRAWAITRACEAQFTAVGAAEAQINAVTSAGTALRASVDGATSEAQIVAAFQSYHDVVIAELQSAANAQASAIVAMDTAINAATGAKLTLETTVSAASTTQAVIDTYIAFYNAVGTLVETTLSGAGQTEVDVIAEVLILTNMSF